MASHGLPDENFCAQSKDPWHRVRNILGTRRGGLVTAYEVLRSSGFTFAELAERMESSRPSVSAAANGRQPRTLSWWVDLAGAAEIDFERLRPFLRSAGLAGHGLLESFIAVGEVEK